MSLELFIWCSKRRVLTALFGVYFRHLWVLISYDTVNFHKIGRIVSELIYHVTFNCRLEVPLHIFTPSEHNTRSMTPATPYTFVKQHGFTILDAPVRMKHHEVSPFTHPAKSVYHLVTLIPSRYHTNRRIVVWENILSHNPNPQAAHGARESYPRRKAKSYNKPLSEGRSQTSYRSVLY